MRQQERISSPYPPAYVSKSELRRQLSLSNGIIDRMVSKNLLPAPLDFDGNQRWQWSEVEAYVANNNKIHDHATENEIDDIIAGIDNVSSENNS